MENKPQEKGIEGIQTGLLNLTLQRPKSFNLQRRSEVYYFSNESPRGILKGVPIKNGIYRMDQLETLTEIPDVAETGYGICSDALLNSNESLNTGEHSTVVKKDDSEHHIQKMDTILESHGKDAGSTPWAYDLKNLDILGAYNNYPKTNRKNAQKDTNQDQEKDFLNKLFEGPEKKNQPSTEILEKHSEKHSEKLTKCVADEKYGKAVSASKIRDVALGKRLTIVKTITDL